MERYRSPWWAPGRHAQTILPALVNLIDTGEPVIDWTRTRWPSPDGDFIDVDWAGDPKASRVLVLFHGLEGSRDMQYARALARAAMVARWRFAFVNFRGCSGEDNRACRAYHAGDSQEVDWILRKFAKTHASVCAAGVSLGGNALLKWAGEQGGGAKKVVRAVVGISAPLDLETFSRALARGFSIVYSWYFLFATPLREKSLRILQRCNPPPFHRDRLLAARTLAQFDDAVTAPLHGFKSGRDYWTRSSCLPYLSGIRVPALILNARNDPFLPSWILEKVQRGADELAPEVELEFPCTGGHTGFPGRNQWMARRVMDFIS